MDEQGLLEREHELTALRGAFEALSLGNGSALLFEAPLGMGKSRLLERAMAMAGDRGLRVMSSRGVQLEREFAFGAIRQLFEAVVVKASEQDRREWLSGAAADVSVLFEQPTMDVPMGEFAFLHGLYWLTANLCQRNGLVLIMDDLHWTDELSLRFLAYLLPRLSSMPVLLLAATRSPEPDSAHVLNLVTIDSSCRVMAPSALSVAGAAQLIERSSGYAADPAFIQACHRITHGNPLFLTELLRALEAEGVAPEACNVGEVSRVGPQAIGRRVELEMMRLTPQSCRLVEVLSVLAPHADLDRTAAIAELDRAQTDRSLSELARVHLVRPAPDGHFEFVHPLVQTVVYERIDHTRLASYHTLAARLLEHSGAPAEEVAAHLLKLPMTGDQAKVAVLRRAAEQAQGRGASESAFTYLRRALAEPPTHGLQTTILTDAGLIGINVDVESAVHLLGQARSRLTEPHAVGKLATRLGLALFYLGRADQAVEVLSRAIDDLGGDDGDLYRELQAVLIAIPSMIEGWSHLTHRIPDLRRLPPADTLGALILDSMICAHDTLNGDPRGIEPARVSVADSRLVSLASQGSPMAAGPYYTLALGDLDAGLVAQEEVIKEARRHGALTGQILHLFFRAVAWVRRGDLAEAEADMWEARHLANIVQFSLALPIQSATLAEICIERGDVESAAALLRSVKLSEDVIPVEFALARGRLLFVEGAHKKALEAALNAGKKIGGNNPGIAPWRSQAALILHALGDDKEARRYAEEEIELAVRWGAPYAIGHAVRVAGLLTPGADGLALLRQAVDILRSDPARLARAYAHVDLGVALWRQGVRTEARQNLSAGLDLATHCGAIPLVNRAREELRAAGVRPRRLAAIGIDALTPSERRVAALAAQGLTNRGIAQQLYVTVKTVEAHLGSVYRKLGIVRREELAAKLRSPGG